MKPYEHNFPTKCFTFVWLEQSSIEAWGSQITPIEALESQTQHKNNCFSVKTKQIWIVFPSNKPAPKCETFGRVWSFKIRRTTFLNILNSLIHGFWGSETVKRLVGCGPLKCINPNSCMWFLNVLSINNWLYTVQNRRSTDFDVLKWQKGLSVTTIAKPINLSIYVRLRTS